MSQNIEVTGMSESSKDGKPLDLERLNTTFMQNDAIVKQILSAFKDSFGDFEGQFREAENAGDVECMSRLAHSLKGSAGNIAADEIASQAADLQHKIDDGVAQDQIDHSFDHLLESLDELNKYIDDIV